ncbi:MAG: hypothetical protein Q9M23_00440, partial [Mariprofundaceae bacterium]|nr:hypothetical protein [Mariprofundaceae bacterium]
MSKGLTWYFRIFSVACLLMLSACPTTVPPPSSQIDKKPDSLKAAALENIAPDQEFASFTPFFADLDDDGN